MIYGILILLIFLLYLLMYSQTKGKRNYCLLMWMLFSLLAGMRDSTIGTDTPSYVRSFLFAPTISLPYILKCFKEEEALFHIFESLLRTITDNYTVFLLLIALFYMAAVIHFVFENSTSPAISLLLFMSMGYFSFSMAGLRQTIAMSLMIFAVSKLFKKKYVSAVLLLSLSVGFHISSLVYLLVFLSFIIPLNFLYIGFIAILSGVMAVYGSNIVNYMVDRIWNGERIYDVGLSGGISTLILLIAVTTFCLVTYSGIFTKRSLAIQLSDHTEPDILSRNRVMAKLLLISIPFQILALVQANAFRLSLPFHFFMIALLPNSINVLRDKKLRIVGKICLIFLLLIQFFFITINNSDISPYLFAKYI